VPQMNRTATQLTKDNKTQCIWQMYASDIELGIKLRA